MHYLRAICTPAQFNQLIQPLPPPKVAKIKAALASSVISDLGREIAEQMHMHMHGGNHPYGHSVFKEKEVSYGLLFALRNNFIGMHQYITAQNYYFHTTQTQRRPTFIPLSKPNIERVIKSTMRGSKPNEKMKPPLDAAQISTLFAEMTKAAPSEQGFFLYAPSKVERSFSQLFPGMNWNALMQEPRSKFCMLPTHSLVDAFTKIKFQGMQMKWFPCLGTPAPEDYAKWHSMGIRPIQIPFEEHHPRVYPGMTSEDQGADLYKYEIVQYWNGSNCGQSVINNFQKMAQFTTEFAQKCDPEHAEHVKRLASSMIVDLSNPVFRSELLHPGFLYTGKETGAELFWLAWNGMLVHDLYKIDELDEAFRKYGFFDELAERLCDPTWSASFLCDKGLNKAHNRLINLAATIDKSFSFAPMTHFEYMLLLGSNHPLKEICNSLDRLGVTIWG